MTAAGSGGWRQRGARGMSLFFCILCNGPFAMYDYMLGGQQHRLQRLGCVCVLLPFLWAGTV